MTFKLLYRVGQAKQRGHLKTPADHRNGEECQGCACPKANSKETLNVLYRLTTEMGEGQGWENRE